MIKIRFNPVHVPRLAMFMANHDIRYYLNGIKIEKAKGGGLYLVASDGHTMAVIHDKHGDYEGPDEGLIMKASPGLVSACKSVKRFGHGLEMHVVINGDRISIANDFGFEHSETELFVQAGKPWIDGNYPNWRKILPDFTKLQRGFADGVNAENFARFSKMDGHYKYISIWQEHKAGPIIVQHHEIPEMLSIVMPIRDDGPGLAVFDKFPRKVQS